MRIQQFLTCALAISLIGSATDAEAAITELGVYDLETGGLPFSPVGLGFHNGMIQSRGGVNASSPSGTHLAGTPGALSLPPAAPTTLSTSSFAFTNPSLTGDYSSASEAFTGELSSVSAGDLIWVYKESGGQARSFLVRGTNPNDRVGQFLAGDFTNGNDFVGMTYHGGRNTLMALDTAGNIVEINPADGTELAVFEASPAGATPMTFGSTGGGATDGGDIEYVTNPLTGQEALLIVGSDSSILRRVGFDGMGLGSNASITDFALTGAAGNFTGLAIDTSGGAGNDITYISSTDGMVYAYGSVVATAVPEPGSFAVIACLGVAGAVRHRRRRKKAAEA